MKPPKFGYHKPSSVADALSALADLGEGAVVLSGGQSLIPMLNLRLAQPSDVIDLGGVSELSSVTVDDSDGNTDVAVGAMVTHRQMEVDPAIGRCLPLAQRAASFIGYRAIRNRGTVGGSVAHADPAAEWPVVLIALDGSVELRSMTATRRVAGEDFFESFLTTSKQPEELVTAVRFSSRFANSWGFSEFQRRTGDFAVVAVAVACVLSEGDIAADINEARIAVAGVTDKPVRCVEAEQVLMSTRDPAAAAQAARETLEPTGDAHGSAEFRKQLIYAETFRACAEAVAGSREVMADA